MPIIRQQLTQTTIPHSSARTFRVKVEDILYRILDEDPAAAYYDIDNLDAGIQVDGSWTYLEIKVREIRDDDR